MYPTLSYFIYDITGHYFPLPLFTFGIMFGISFAFAYYIFYIEFKRKENEGILHPRSVTRLFGKTASMGDMLIGAGVAGIIAYKVIGLFTHYSDASENPQDYIKTIDGSVPGFIVGAGLSFALSYFENQKIRKQYPEPVTREVNTYPHELMGNIFMVAAVCGLIGAKVFDALENWDAFIKDPVEQLISFSGLTFYGGLICGGAGVIIYTRKHNIPLLHLLDIGAPAMMLAYGVGRIGCHLAGDGDWGVVNTAPKPGWMQALPDWMWSFTYPRNVNHAGDVILQDVPGNFNNALAQPVWPTPFYEAILGILLFFLLWSMRKRLKTPGLLFGIYLIINGIERFCIELIRVNSRYHIGNFSFTQAEMIATFLFIGGIALSTYVLLRKKDVSTQV